jgi:hypothetical protein
MDDDALELLSDDDFVFEPVGWDFAVEMGIRLDRDDECEQLRELADAMLVWMRDGPELERLTTEAMEELWTDDLEAGIREGVALLGEREEWRAAAVAALAELDRDPRSAEVARDVVRHLAMQRSHLDTPVFFCVHCLDEACGSADPPERRRIAVRTAIVARRDAAVAEHELARVVAAPTRRDELATRERRLAVRQRLGRIASLGRESLPALAPELQAIADEPLPATAADDDVWEVVCGALLADVAAPERN